MTTSTRPRVLAGVPLLVSTFLIGSLLIGPYAGASPASASADPTEAQLDQWAARLTKTPVLMTPGSDLTPGERQRIRRAVDQESVPTYVLAVDGRDWQVTADEVAIALDGRIQDNDPDHAVVVYLGEETLPESGLSGAVDNRDPRAAELFIEELPERDPSERFTRLVEVVAAGEGEEALDGKIADMWEDTGDAFSPSDSVTGDSDPGVTRWIVLALIAALVGVFVLLRGRAVAGWWKRRRRASRLEAYSGEARSARDRATAQRRLLALGEAIDAAEMRPHDDAKHWQRALDYYALAGRVADQRKDETDDVGVIVLSDLGQRHLAAAHGAAFDDTPRCYVDPLHGPAFGRGIVDRNSVPLCEQCLRSKPERRRPFLVEGKPWYRTGRAPWVGSGYGALVDLQVSVPNWLAHGD